MAQSAPGNRSGDPQTWPGWPLGRGENGNQKTPDRSQNAARECEATNWAGKSHSPQCWRQGSREMEIKNLGS